MKCDYCKYNIWVSGQLMEVSNTGIRCPECLEVTATPYIYPEPIEIDIPEPRSAYSKLLEDPRWQDKRYSILVRDNFKCRQCSEERYLHVHHIKYTGKPWGAPDKDLVTLCETCHTKEHNK